MSDRRAGLEWLRFRGARRRHCEAQRHERGEWRSRLCTPSHIYPAAARCLFHGMAVGVPGAMQCRLLAGLACAVCRRDVSAHRLMSPPHQRPVVRMNAAMSCPWRTGRSGKLPSHGVTVTSVPLAVAWGQHSTSVRRQVRKSPSATEDGEREDPRWSLVRCRIRSFRCRAERFVQAPADARFDADEATVRAGHTVLEAALPPPVDVFSEYAKRLLAAPPRGGYAPDHRVGIRSGPHRRARFGLRSACALNASS